VGRTPDAVAVVYEEESLSYRELNARANRLARYLQDLGVGPEVGVGICAQRGIEMMIGVLATLKAGGAYVPLDPAYPVERLRYMLQDSGARVLLHARLAEEVSLGLREWADPAVVRVDVCMCGYRAMGESLGSEPGSPVNGSEAEESGVRDLHLRLERSAQGSDGRASQHGELYLLGRRGVHG
jgi:acyl-coenzyme A synthetase/AMP-(fatty) acid ligase